MPTDYLNSDLIEQISKGQVVAIIGAGVSLGATGANPLAGWVGLLKDGVKRCEGVASSKLSPGWSGRVLGQIDSGDTDEMILAAENISLKLGAPHGGEFRRWLRNSFETLKCRDSAVLIALRELGIPLATTNYDQLIEDATGLRPITWMDGARVSRWIHGDEPGVFHLHGFWEVPESVILGVRSYDLVMGDARAQNVQKALRTTKSFLFVGCGAGLEDPNFDALLKWSGQIFEGDEYRHFRLALEKDVRPLQEKHPDEQRIFVLPFGDDHGDLPDYLRSLKPAKSPAPNPVPVPPTSSPFISIPAAGYFFGRDDELLKLVAALDQDTPPPIPILGPAGIGKSTLTLKALADPRIVNRFGDRRYFIRCDGATSAEGLLGKIAEGLGIELNLQIEHSILTRLEAAPALLALDNLETPWHADTLPVEAALNRLAAVPGLGLVASIRGQGRPMGLAWRAPFALTPLNDVEAKNVFLAIAGDHLREDNNLNPLLGALEGLPLAITLLAYRAEGEPSLENLWLLWYFERTRLLHRAGGASRDTNLEVSYEISIASPKMTEYARRLLSLLALLPDGMSREYLPVGLARTGPPAAISAAVILSQVGLAFYESDRIRLPAPLREYVSRNRPPDISDFQLLENFFVNLAVEGELVASDGGAEAVAAITPEFANIPAVLRLSLGGKNAIRAVAGAIGFARFQKFTGVGSPEVLQLAAATAADLDEVVLQANCIFRIGEIALSRSDHELARQEFEEGLRLYRKVGAALGQANCVHGLGEIAKRRSEHEAAQKKFEEALPLYRNVGDLLGEANCIRSLGDIALERSDYEAAYKKCEEALPLYRKVGAVLGEANCIRILGDIAMGRSDYEVAFNKYEDALQVYREVGSVLGEANCIHALGDVALIRSENEVARLNYEEALPLYRKVGDDFGEANCIMRLADLALRQLR